MSDPASLAASLGKPVANGLLSLLHAEAAIAAAAARTSSGPLDEQLHIYNHILALNIQNHQAKRERTSGAIKRILRPLIATHRPWNELLAEAHDANGSNGFPLTEQQVSDIVEIEVWFSLPKPPWRRYGR